MLIEYQFKFEKNGFTLTQRIESGASNQQGETEQHVREEKGVKASYQQGEPATGAGPKSGAGPKPGGSPGPNLGEVFRGFNSGAGLATFIGPFIIWCPPDDSNKENKK